LFIPFSDPVVTQAAPWRARPPEKPENYHQLLPAPKRNPELSRKRYSSGRTAAKSAQF
jgi:hypothetical protein